MYTIDLCCCNGLPCNNRNNRNNRNNEIILILIININQKSSYRKACTYLFFWCYWMSFVVKVIGCSFGNGIILKRCSRIMMWLIWYWLQWCGTPVLLEAVQTSHRAELVRRGRPCRWRPRSIGQFTVLCPPALWDPACSQHPYLPLSVPTTQGIYIMCTYYVSNILSVSK